MVAAQGDIVRTFMTALMILSLLPVPVFSVTAEAAEAGGTMVDLEFSGYRFGQEPAANMVCLSGYCKSQAPGGDGIINFPFSTYGTPGAVTTLAGLSVVNPRYTFWNDHLYRIFFKVVCTPQGPEECVSDIITALDNEYSLTEVSSNESRQFVLKRHITKREFVTESGAFVRVRAATLVDGPQMPTVDIADREMANLVGSSLNPNFKQNNPVLPEKSRKKSD